MISLSKSKRKKIVIGHLERSALLKIKCIENESK